MAGTGCPRGDERQREQRPTEGPCESDAGHSACEAAQEANARARVERHPVEVATLPAGGCQSGELRARTAER